MTTLRCTCRHVVDNVVDQLLVDAKSLHHSVPTYDHLLNDKKKVNLKLAADHLCKWPGKSALGSGCIALDKNLTFLSAAHVKWGLPGTLLDDSSYDGKVETIDDIFQTARKALATIAGVNCLTNMNGKARLDRRTALLSQVPLMPQVLGKLLRQQK